MPTIAFTIRDLQGQFTRAGIDTPRLDAELLVGHALDLSRSQLLAHLSDGVDPAAAAEMTDFARRRIAGEPVAYIVGRKEFFGLTLTVSPAVLSPRPETELLVEWAIAWLNDHPASRMIDVGTGSGAIAVAIASSTAGTAPIKAVDISEDALAVARANADRHVPGRIDFRSSDLLEHEQGEFDLILANPPYLRADQIDGNRDLAAEPRIALDGGPGGLKLIERLVFQLPGSLAPGGAAAIEMDPSQAAGVAKLLRSVLPDAVITVHKDLAGLDRFVTAVRI